MKFKLHIFFLLISFIILNSLSCSSGAGNPQSALVGQWAIVTQNSGADAFATNLGFTQEGTLSTESAWFEEGKNYEYVVIAPGRMKISWLEQSEVINFSIEEDVLTLIFEDGYNEYKLVSSTSPVSSTSIDMAVEVESTNTAVPPLPTNTYTLVPTNTNELATITPENTQTITLIATSTVSVYKTPTPKVYFPISNCAASQLYIGDSAYVSYEGGTNKLRRTPDTHPKDNITGEILPGDVVEIIGGPKCNYGWILWKVQTTDDETGWTPESDGNEFWLIPIETRKLCSDALPSRLFVGGIAFVEEEPDLANRVRSEPDTEARIIDRIEPKGKMTILEGPECGEGTTWWKVKSFESGIVGWTMESRYGEYYLAPIP